MAEIIDAHHHLWRYNEAEYAWITPEISLLKRDFLPEDLGREMTASGVNGCVVVQARQSLDETRWLLKCAEASPFIRGVVGWLPLVQGSVTAELDEFIGAEKLKGVRHIVQDEADNFLLREDFNAGVRALLGTGLVYDILIYERQLPQATEFVRRHPEQVFVLDHMAKPKIRERKIDEWRKNLFALADAGQVYCKISGLVTEAQWDTWTLDQLKPYLDTALEAFGAGRLMAGSDWPVCLLASDYCRWWCVVEEWLEGLSAVERALILGGTAVKVYRLG